MDKIDKVVIKYISGREETLDIVEAMKRVDWLDNKDAELLFSRQDPFLRISKFGDEITFEIGQEKKVFKNMEELGKDLYFSKLYQINILDK